MGLRSLDSIIELSYLPKIYEVPHSLELYEDEYYACEKPEAPPGEGMFWDENCRACGLVYKANQINNPSFGIWFMGELRSLSDVNIVEGRWELA